MRKTKSPLFKLRKNAMIDRYDLAHKIKLSFSTISHVESGAEKGSLRTIKKYADYFNIDFEKLKEYQWDWYYDV